MIWVLNFCGGERGFWGACARFFLRELLYGGRQGLTSASEKRKDKGFNTEDTERKHPSATLRAGRVQREKERFNAEFAEDAEFAEKSREEGERGTGWWGSSLPVINWEGILTGC